jgi:hypothetical protein
MNTSPRARLVTLLLLLWITPAYAPAADYTGSKTVIGRTNTLLAEGARALEAGHFEEGVRLTLDGLKAAIDAHENAIGHSNACAGYVRINWNWTAQTGTPTTIVPPSTYNRGCSSWGSGIWRPLWRWRQMPHCFTRA